MLYPKGCALNFPKNRLVQIHAFITIWFRIGDAPALAIFGQRHQARHRAAVAQNNNGFAFFRAINHVAEMFFDFADWSFHDQ